MVYRHYAKMLEYLKNPFDYLPSKVKITEVSARDGLQAQKKIFTLEQRLTYVNKLTDCGFKSIEIGSFVSPKIIPQMSNTLELSNLIRKREDVQYLSLIPNEIGLQNFLKSGSTEGAVLLSACEVFSKKNINKTISESVKDVEKICTVLHNKNVPFRGYISCAFNSPFANVKIEDVTYLANVLKDLNCKQIILADTTGKAEPEDLSKTFSHIKKDIHVENLGIHLHDSCGLGTENILMSLSHGISKLDSSILGIGGCPNSPNARGNINTMTLIQILERFNIQHDIDIHFLITAQNYLCKLLQEK